MAGTVIRSPQKTTRSSANGRLAAAAARAHPCVHACGRLHDCGTRRFSPRPRRFAYIEFADKSAVDNALILNNTEFRGRALKIMHKRTNMPSFVMAAARGGYRGRGSGRGAPRGHYGGGHYQPRGAAYAAGGYFAPRGGGAGYAPRGRGGYHPRGAPRGRGRGAWASSY